jgi:hypothetical protein
MLQALSPHDRKEQLVVVIEIRNGELIETVAKEAHRLGLDNGAIVSLIGAVDTFTISTMPGDRRTRGRDH